MRLRTLVVATLALAITGTVAPAAHAEPTTAELTKKIEAESNKHEDIAESYNKMRLSLKQTKAEEKKLAESMGPAKEALDAASEQVQVIASSAYMTGKAGTVNVLLGDSNELIERMAILEQISDSQQADIDRLTASTKDYTARQAALKATQDKQAAEVKELGDRKKKIEANLKELYALRTAAYGKAEETGTKYTGTIPSVSGSAGKAVTFAYNQIGDMYLYGASGPDRWDCSGLTSGAWANAGVSLPHNAAAQYNATTRVSRSQLKAGDLVFYRGNAHVGIYVGGGQIIDASTAGAPVKKRSIDIMTPNGYGRVS